MQSIEYGSLRFGEGAFAGAATIASLFLRVNPNVIFFATIWASSQSCIECRICHKLEFHESLPNHALYKCLDMHIVLQLRRALIHYSTLFCGATTGRSGALNPSS